jgi:hypothetical protein
VQMGQMRANADNKVFPQLNHPCRRLRPPIAGVYSKQAMSVWFMGMQANECFALLSAQ